MKLFLIKTKGVKEFYIVANDPTEACYRLTNMLDKSDYGYSDSRRITQIDILADEITLFGSSSPTPNFSNSCTQLILPNSCE